MSNVRPAAMPGSTRSCALLRTYSARPKTVCFRPSSRLLSATRLFSIEPQALSAVVTSTNWDVGAWPKMMRKLSSVQRCGTQKTLPPIDSHSDSGLTAIVTVQ